MKVRSEGFESFIEAHGEASMRVPASESQVEAYRGRLPDSLLDVWAEEGFSGYGNGRLWLTNPADFAGIAELWLKETPLWGLDHFHVVARTAFGSMLVWGEKTNHRFWVHIAQHWVVASTKAFEKPTNLRVAEYMLFANLSEVDGEVPGRIDTSASLFELCRDRYGDLKSDEVYGFEPPLQLGGTQSPDAVARLRMDVHLSILAELSPPHFTSLDQR